MQTSAQNSVATSTPPPDWLSAAPTLFVVMWSTGFIGMKLGSPFAEPFTFMALRMVIVVVLFGLLVGVARAPWPTRSTDVVHAVIAGLLVHATYLSGILHAISLALPLGFVALVAGLQPLLTALFARLFLGERLRPHQCLGMVFGFTGVLLVIASKYAVSGVNAAALLSAAIGLLGITIGTIYQKKFCANLDLRTSGVIQFSATGVVMFALALAFETREVVWSAQFVFALGWLSIVLSIGAISLLYLMIRHGAASKVASLFFLTPAVTALMAFALFGESLSPLALIGLLVSACGVALVIKK